jgi:hypothetical protein
MVFSFPRRHPPRHIWLQLDGSPTGFHLTEPRCAVLRIFPFARNDRPRLIDNKIKAQLKFLPSMRRLSIFISVLFLAIWLPATEHCNLEAAGFIAKQCSDDCGQAGSDGCNLVESGFYKSAPQVAKVSAPSLLAIAPFLCLEILPSLEAVEPLIGLTESLDRPRNWVTSWQFVRRAAPLSRAPSLVG